jgi:2'-5' RNA ligase
MVATVNAENNLNKDEKYFYVYLTENLEEDSAFKHTPQHITLVPPFEAKRQDVLGVAKEAASEYRPFEVETGGHTMFGVEKDINVILIKPNQILQSMHMSLLNKLKERNININYQHFIRDEFTPHVTIKSFHPEINESKTLAIGHIAVMHKLKGVKTVLKIESLGQDA